MKLKGSNRIEILLILFFLGCIGTLPAFAEEWKTLPTRHFYLHYLMENQKLVELLNLKVDKIYKEVTEDLGYRPKAKISVYLCPTETCFKEKQPYSQDVPHWAVGVAYPSLNRIVMRFSLVINGQVLDPIQLFKHEFAHIALEQALEATGGAPRWLSEGFAMYEAKEWGVPEEMTLQEVALLENFIPLSELTLSFPSDVARARIAYAQSLSLVTYILNTYGKDALHRLIKNLGEGVSPETALRRATGVDLNTLEQDWQRNLREKHSWIPVVTSITVLWGFITLIFFGAYLFKKRRIREIEKIWEEEEKEVEEYGSKDELPVPLPPHASVPPRSPTQ